jgi:molybdenum cofactor guanylyltransferase
VSDSTQPLVAGAVLAGGASRRMGRDKAHVAYGGEPMLARVAGALAGAGVDPVVVVGGDADKASELGLLTIADGWPGEGPLGGLLTACAWSPHPLVFVVGCDLPELTSEVISQVIDGLGNHDAAVARTDRTEPLCAVWRVDACMSILSTAFGTGERALHKAWKRLDRVDIQVGPTALLNVNTPNKLR